MKVIEKDILSITEGIIGHQVNTKGVMGAGLALKLKNKYPLMFKEYKTNLPSLGITQLVKVEDNLYIANIAGQEGYGFKGVHTNYDALNNALFQLSIKVKELGLPLYLPYKMGAGLGGGDWNKIEEIIKTNIPEAIICKYI